MIDWQVLRYSSPVIDLLHVLFTATDKGFREKHSSQLMKLYHSTLSETIIALGSDPEKLFSWQSFQNQLKKLGKFALLVAPSIIGLRFANSEDVVSMDDLGDAAAESEPGACDMHLIKGISGASQEIYNQTIVDLVADLFDFGYL